MFRAAKNLPNLQRLGRTISVILLLCCLSFAKNPARNPKLSAGLSTQFHGPYEVVLKAVRSVSEDGIIQGSWEYKNTKEIDHAQPADESRAFGEWKGEGTVLYKVKVGALAPENFYDSADQGTVTVRYVVTPAGDRLTTVHIDAVFQQDSGHSSHVSNGQVEQKEMDAVAGQLKTFIEEEVDQQQAAIRQEQDAKIGDLQAALDHETAQLQAVLAREKELREKLQHRTQGKPGHIRTSNADLKSQPNSGSKTLQSLSQGDEVTVVQETSAWKKVQARNGEQGWIFGLMVDVVK